MGSQGSWFATVDGESLPCVHKICTDGRWPHYVDEGVSDDEPKWGPFITAIAQGKRVILTTGHTTAEGKAGRRDRYIAIYSVKNVEVRDNELHFELVDRLRDLKP